MFDTMFDTNLRDGIKKKVLPRRLEWKISLSSYEDGLIFPLYLRKEVRMENESILLRGWAYFSVIHQNHKDNQDSKDGGPDVEVGDVIEV
jgi:hypothetical protein